MTDEHFTTQLCAAWRDDEYAYVIPKDAQGIGEAMVRELARSPYTGQYLSEMAVKLYLCVGPLANHMDEDGNPVGPIVGPLEAFGEPVPSIPVGNFVIFAREEEAGEFDGVDEASPEVSAQLEAAAILANAEREIRGETNGSTN